MTQRYIFIEVAILVVGLVFHLGRDARLSAGNMLLQSSKTKGMSETGARIRSRIGQVLWRTVEGIEIFTARIYLPIVLRKWLVRLSHLLFVIMWNVFLYTLPHDYDISPKKMFVQFFSGLPHKITGDPSNMIGWGTLICTFIFFILSQQKISSRTRNFLTSEPALLFVTSVLVVISNSIYLHISMSKRTNLVWATLLDALAYVATIVFLIRMFIDAIRSTSVRTQLSQLTRLWADLSLGLYLGSVGSKRPHASKFYQDIRTIEEDVLQALMYCVDNNQRHILEQFYTEWISMIWGIDMRLFVTSSRLREVRFQLYMRCKEEFVPYYKSLLDSQVRLISKLQQAGDPLATKAVDDFFAISLPDEEDLCLTHLEVVARLCRAAANDGAISLRLAERLMNYVQSNITTQESFLVMEGLMDVFGTLLDVAILRHDRRLLSDAAHLMIQGNEYWNSLEYHGPVFEFELSTVTLLVKATLKCIELEHFEQIGFLSNFLTSQLAESYISGAFSHVYAEIKTLSDSPINSYHYDDTWFALHRANGLNCILKFALIINGQYCFRNPYSSSAEFPCNLTDDLVFGQYSIQECLNELVFTKESYKMAFLFDGSYLQHFRKCISSLDQTNPTIRSHEVTS